MENSSGRGSIWVCQQQIDDEDEQGGRKGRKVTD
jgi:hypothetical protein